jgi:hypothetical protein
MMSLMEKSRTEGNSGDKVLGQGHLNRNENHPNKALSALKLQFRHLWRGSYPSTDVRFTER